jgi:hypothetical protein
MFREHSNNDTSDSANPGRDWIDELLGRLIRIETTLDQLLRQKAIKEWYTTEEAASILGKAPFTVREWCRHGRVKATKRDCGRGNSKEWIISREELMRIQAEGLLPEQAPYRHVR